ncbi:MAG: glycine--tRNA ligase subunit beta, partial [Rhodospirillaceae bacterium]|nr:glycine--tRNA ligase subunit beta [Rhodospirillaceae bacterium]
MAELLLELFSEEIPARMQARAADDLKRLVETGLKDAGLSWDKAEAFAGPRRLALVIDGLPTETPDVAEEKKGPAVGAPQQAIDGFLKSNNLGSIDECEVRDVKGKPTYFLVTEKKGGPTGDLLSGIILSALDALNWPKSMKWGEGQKRWVRPLHNILATFDTNVVSATYEGVAANNKTFGHRFLAPGEIAVKNFADYRAKLAGANVMLCASERRAEILAGAEKLASKAGVLLKSDEGLLQEVTGLVEWPVVLMGSIDETFMELPPEVLSATMKLHQKFFSLLNADGTLAAKFIVVSNQAAPDNGAAIIAGNERVLRARLSDAKFFWDNDRKQTLSSRAPQLKNIVFHAKLGTVDEKIDRVQALAASIADFVPGAEKNAVRSAARLAKCDLVSGMVGELPELQGIMGRYLALNDGESADVANAIAEHYSPLGPNDNCPKAPVSVAVALADKIDTLVGFWTIDEKPTGSKDPFALRRAALGVIRLIVENKLRVNLKKIFEIAGGEKIADDLLAFFADRLKVHLKSEGVRHDLIDAVMSAGDEDDLVRLLARVDALSSFLKTDDGANL